MKVAVSEALNIAIDAQKNGRISDAERIYLDILLNFPSHPDALHNLGILVLSKGDEQKARNYLSRSIAANPKVKQFWLSYLNLLIDSGNLGKAKEVFSQAEYIGITNDPFVNIRRALGLSGNEMQPTYVTALDSGSLSTKEVAAKAKVHRDTLLRWLRNGSIPEPKRDHRGWRKFSYAELAAIIKFTQIGSSKTDVAIDSGPKQTAKWISL